MIKLYDYWRSSAAYRLRIALNLKGVDYESVIVDIHPDRSAQFSSDYRAVNPQMRVPAVDIGGEVVGQSMAILEWLDETYSEPPLLPDAPLDRLKARAFADTIACDIHPLNNLSVLKALRTDMDADQSKIAHWYADWIHRGFQALEARAKVGASGFLFGDRPSLAEICLVPQIANARRFDVALDQYPKLVRVDAQCRALDAFKRASPEAVKQD